MASILLRSVRIPSLARLGHRQIALSCVMRDASKDKPTEEKNKKYTRANARIFDGGPVTWKSLLIGGSMLASLTATFVYIKNQKQARIQAEKNRSYGRAAIGGSFDMIDTEGKTRTSDEFLGKWCLIYFGFTHCPDVCPEELEKLATVVSDLKKDKIDILPIFISVDPDRDTPELVGKYLKEFSEHFLGLTGSREQVQKATRAYRVYYSAGPKDRDEDYIVDHTIISYLVNPKGELADYFGQTKTADEIQAMIRYLIKTYKG